MTQPLRIYTFVPQGSHASYYYRVMVPLQTAEKMGLPVQALVDTNLEGVRPEDRVRNFCEADLVLLYQPIGDGTLNNIKMAKSFLPSKRDGTWKYPPTFVMDTDDNLFRVDPHNGAFKNLGIHDPEGRKIPKGHSLAHVENGVRKVLWKDGQDDFDVSRNQATIETYRELLNHADCVTCTTPRLKGHMEAESSPRQVKVAPNLVQFYEYPQIDIRQPGQQKTRILWQGGANHYHDWLPLRDALGRITKKYPHVHWLMWGVQYPWAMELIPPDRMSFIPWAPYHEYKLRRMMMNDDISLAPLANNSFNDCRSAIKWYEASVAKHPAATLAQNTGPYADEIEDGKTGMLFDTPEEFESKLSQLIESKEQRRTLAANAKDWLSENRDAMKEVPKLIQFYQQLRDEAPSEQPHMPDKAWDEYEARIKAQEAAATAQGVPQAA